MLVSSRPDSVVLVIPVQSRREFGFEGEKKPGSCGARIKDSMISDEAREKNKKNCVKIKHYKYALMNFDKKANFLFAVEGKHPGREVCGHSADEISG